MQMFPVSVGVAAAAAASKRQIFVDFVCAFFAQFVCLISIIFFISDRISFSIEVKMFQPNGGKNSLLQKTSFDCSVMHEN